MNRIIKAGIVVVAIAAVATATNFAMNSGRPSPAMPQRADQPSAAPSPASAMAGMPRLVDLGAGRCIPCKKMAPILEELKKEYAGRLQVDFIDVWVDPEAGKPYGIKLIPTQIVFDPSGRELFRHEGFIDKEDILAKWKELGFSLSAGVSAIHP